MKPLWVRMASASAAASASCGDSALAATRQTGDVRAVPSGSAAALNSGEAVEDLSLEAWLPPGSPASLVAAYAADGVTSLHDWQAACLRCAGIKPLRAPKTEEAAAGRGYREDYDVLDPATDACHGMAATNLVFAAPTSGGKTLVAELLMLRALLLRDKKVLFVVPYVSICIEKVGTMTRLWGGMGAVVRGFFSNRGGSSLEGVDVAVATTERANSLLNRALLEGTVHRIGCIVVDELHMVTDPGRGYIAELLLMKALVQAAASACGAGASGGGVGPDTAPSAPLLAATATAGAAAGDSSGRGYGVLGDHAIQLVGMSATLANIEDMARWLGARLYVSTHRPVPLHEFVMACGVLLDKHLRPVRVYQLREASPLADSRAASNGDAPPPGAAKPSALAVGMNVTVTVLEDGLHARAWGSAASGARAAARVASATTAAGAPHPALNAVGPTPTPTFVPARMMAATASPARLPPPFVAPATLQRPPNDFECQLALCAESVGGGKSVLIFCSSKDNCASTAKGLADRLHDFPEVAAQVRHGNGRGDV
jgi:hypothetical protein